MALRKRLAVPWFLKALCLAAAVLFVALLTSASDDAPVLRAMGQHGLVQLLDER